MALLNATTYGDVVDAVAGYLPTVMSSRPDVFTDLSGNPVVWPVNNYMADQGPNKTYPCVTLTEAGEIETNLPGDTENLHTLYPINVLIEGREAITADPTKDYWLAVRKCLMDAFRQRLLSIGTPFTGQPTCQTDVKPRAVFNKGDEQYQFVRSHFLLLVWVNEQRVQP
ncbi:MAG: hypothetical protein KGJ09_09235 [Candidatus Omnitrophica bacterium]|nr:hypothetical protein [Candidatus Omnitrophota bacterium]